MSKTSNSSLSGQQPKPGNTTNSEYQSQQKQNQDLTGRKCTKCGKSGEHLRWYTAKNTWGNTFTREMCSDCYSKQANSRSIAVRKEYGPGSTYKLIRANRPPEGTPCANFKVCGHYMTYDKKPTGMCFDHNPVTDTFRGYICKRCNTGYGLLGDSYESVLQSLDYLR